MSVMRLLLFGTARPSRLRGLQAAGLTKKPRDEAGRKNNYLFQFGRRSSLK